MLNNILQYLERTAARVPDRVAFSDGTGTAGGETLTFQALRDGAARAGAELCRRGYRGEPIALLMGKRPRTVMACLSVVYAGCCYACLDESSPAARLGRILDVLSPRLLLCDERNERAARALVEQGLFPGEVRRFSEFLQAPADEAGDALLAGVREAQIDTDPVYVVFTSGSTGTPKGVAACHRSVIDYAEALCEALGFSEGTVFGNQAPFCYDAPLKEILPAIRCGATVFLIPRSLFLFPVRLCEYLNANRVNTICWVASALAMVSSFGALDRNPPRYLETVCFGSEVFPRRQYDLWRAALPRARFFNLYGPTEATGMSCYWAARDLEPDEPIPVGRPFRNTGVLLLTEDGRRAEAGEEGEILLRGTCVTLGYYGDPQRTAEAFTRNPLNPRYPEIVYRTGDVGRINERGELVFLYRRDAQFKHMGRRIEPGEIEAAAADVPGVRTACAVYDAPRKRICLYVTGEADPDDVRAALARTLPRYLTPARCERLEALPTRPNGKIDRASLRSRAEAARRD